LSEELILLAKDKVNGYIWSRLIPATHSKAIRPGLSEAETGTADQLVAKAKSDHKVGRKSSGEMQ